MNQKKNKKNYRLFYFKINFLWTILLFYKLLNKEASIRETLLSLEYLNKFLISKFKVQIN